MEKKEENNTAGGGVNVYTISDSKKSFPHVKLTKETLKQAVNNVYLDKNTQCDIHSFMDKI